jgi:mannosylglycoprotein endo-beta-mannosidase
MRKFSAVHLFIIALSGLSGCAPEHVSLHAGLRSNPPRASELSSGWVCMNVHGVSSGGEELSKPSYPLSGWLPATVPGTVLTTLLNNRLIPDPLYGMNNRRIPDIYETGRDTYTYWFVNDFRKDAPSGNRQVWLCFRGINYGSDVYLNGHRMNGATQYGMFLRQDYNVTSCLSRDGNNRLAVLVYPPDPAGNPNGGQGGDGTIGRNVTSQYAAGWDWIQPVHDRNTGIWDKVTIEESNIVRITNPHVVTLVPGKRFPREAQAPALIQASAEIENPTNTVVRGMLSCNMGGVVVQRDVIVPPASSLEARLPDLTMNNPHLWWPNGYGPQTLYPLHLEFTGTDGVLLDEKSIHIGIREIQTRWNKETQSREVLVNGQQIFIKGGNWITSDAMLRLSPERYDAEVRFHRDMNLNLIRIWGGGITERPEFYDACDRYGILVFQDFWISGDCNGKWLDPMKKDDQWTRRRYPDDHGLFLRSVADQVRMLRNHPSLAFYCGGNEIPPPEDILVAMQDSLLPALDRTRYFFPYSNADSMSHNFIGGNGDGTYRAQRPDYFWEHRSFPFNSEIGSVGMGDIESLGRFIPHEDLVFPDVAARRIDSVWQYHKYGGYGRQLDAYGKPEDLRDFADKAQLVNYDQYRALMEGHFAHMWEWYTGLIIWKTQNPWTALRGGMYDCYLDPNAGLYGLHHADEPLHVMLSPSDWMLVVVNHTFRPCHDLMVQARTIDCAGKDSLVFQWVVEIGPSTVQKIDTIRKSFLEKSLLVEGGFMDLRLIGPSGNVLSENLYWLPDSAGSYTGLQHMKKAEVDLEARRAGDGCIDVKIANAAGGPLAFFNRLSVVDRKTKKRILPVFYSDNYVSVLPGEQKRISIEYPPHVSISDAVISLRGWNLSERFLDIH